MKRNIFLIIAVSAFSALLLWISGLASYFYSFNIFLIEKFIELFKRLI